MLGHFTSNQQQKERESGRTVVRGVQARQNNFIYLSIYLSICIYFCSLCFFASFICINIFLENLKFLKNIKNTK